MLVRYIALDMNCGIVDGLLVLNLEAGEVFPTYETPSLHHVHRSGSLVQLEVVDTLDLEYSSSGGFPHACSETDSSQ